MILPCASNRVDSQPLKNVRSFQPASDQQGGLWPDHTIKKIDESYPEVRRVDSRIDDGSDGEYLYDSDRET